VLSRFLEETPLKTEKKVFIKGYSGKSTDWITKDMKGLHFILFKIELTKNFESKTQ
jgi:hypothetical protein